MTSQLTQTLNQMADQARQASLALATLDTQQKNTILLAMAEALIAEQTNILAANALDVANAEKAGLSLALLDRLRLTPERIAAMAHGISQVSELPDPVGEIIAQ